jgi:hypothetical protein
LELTTQPIKEQIISTFLKVKHNSGFPLGNCLLSSFHTEIKDLLGLSTVYHIDGFMVTIYGCHHCTIGVLSRFEPYTAMAQLTPYFTINMVTTVYQFF